MARPVRGQIPHPRIRTLEWRPRRSAGASRPGSARQVDRCDDSVEIGGDARLQIVDRGVDFQPSLADEIGKKLAGGSQSSGSPFGALYRGVVYVVAGIVLYRQRRRENRV